MKTILIFTAAFAMCATAFTQQTFTKTYGTASEEYYNDISVKNGNILIAATNKNADVFALAANQTGGLAWSKVIGSSLIESDVHCAATSDNGSLFFLRRFINGDTPAEGAVVIKCNKNGDVVWSRQMRSKKYKFIVPVAVMENDDNSIMLLYEKNNAWFDSGFFGLAKITGSAIDWETTIYPASANDYNVYSAKTLTKNGNGYIIGAMQNDENFDHDVPVLFYLSGSGKVQQAKNLYDPFSGFNANHTYLQNVFQRNGKTTVVGYYYGDNAKESYFVVSFKPADTAAYASFIANDIFSLQNYVRRKKAVAADQKLLSNVYLTPGYGMQIASSSVYSGQRNNIFLSRYDSLGRICPSNILPPVDSTIQKHRYDIRDHLYNEVNDKVYFDTITFTAKNAGSETDICSGAATNKPAAQLLPVNLTISPNPAKNFIMVDFSLAQTGVVQLEIKDLSGKVWLTQNKFLRNEKLHAQLNIQTLPQGLYFLKTVIDGKQYSLPSLKE